MQSFASLEQRCVLFSGLKPIMHVVWRRLQKKLHQFEGAVADYDEAIGFPFFVWLWALP